jgi:pimeloyl-ACP methyl ester carboxylesterase
MLPDTHHDAPTQFAEAAGIRFAYRRFGTPSGVPIVLNQHFKGTLDHWDPMVTDGLAQGREVILFDNAGVGSTSGEVPASIGRMASNAILFVRSLGYPEIDLLGFSLGGLVAQEIALQSQGLVRRMILIGAGLRGADMTESRAAEIASVFYDPPEHVWLATHFTPSQASQDAGHAFLQRRLRRVDRDLAVGDIAARTQRQAIDIYLASADHVDRTYLSKIDLSVLIVHGSNDVMMPLVNAFRLRRRLPNAKLIVYPDANHAPHFQYPDRFVKHATQFLDAPCDPHSAATMREKRLVGSKARRDDDRRMEGSLRAPSPVITKGPDA